MVKLKEVDIYYENPYSYLIFILKILSSAERCTIVIINLKKEKKKNTEELLPYKNKNKICAFICMYFVLRTFGTTIAICTSPYAINRRRFSH